MKIKKSYGLTNVEDSNDLLIITHNGNMGNSIERSVNPNLEKLEYDTIEELKKKYKCVSEFGTPDYMYQIKFKKI